MMNELEHSLQALRCTDHPAQRAYIGDMHPYRSALALMVVWSACGDEASHANQMQMNDTVTPTAGQAAVPSLDAGMHMQSPAGTHAMSMDAGAVANDAAVASEDAQVTRIKPFPDLPEFGNTTLHPDRISFYMVPDLEGAYTGNWGALQATLHKLHALMPDAWIRWDNETGHNTNDMAQVEKFVAIADAEDVPTVITASARPGYDNMWANRYVTNKPNAIANSSILDIANGGFLGFTNTLLSKYSSVKLVETLNEPDGPGWFVTDPDDASHFGTYMTNLYAAMSIHAGDQVGAAKLVGPSVAFGGQGNIWNDWMARTELTNVSYHTYGDPARKGLQEVTGKNVFVTEYGYDKTPISPAALLDDLWHIEKAGTFSGSIKKVFYNQILQNGGNPSAISQQIESGQDHFAMRGWFRALAAWVDVASLSDKGRLDDAHPDFVAADDGYGDFGILFWNFGSAVSQGDERMVPGTSTRAGVPLYALHVSWNDHSDVHTADCKPLADQSAVSVNTVDNGVELIVNMLAPQDAVYVSTRPCDALAN